MELGLRLECVREGERELGTVPAQIDPDTLSYRGKVNWVRETVRYIPLKESEIVAPANMFIVADQAKIHGKRSR